MLLGGCWLVVVGCWLWVVGCGLWVVGCGYGLWVRMCMPIVSLSHYNTKNQKPKTYTDNYPKSFLIFHSCG